MANQDVKFKIINEVTGMEQMAALINRMGALETQMASVIKANAGLAASNDAVVRNGVRYNNAIDAQSKALKQARQGSQQLGMQINDLATSISTGASPVQAFNQQIGQIGFAMSMMEGKAGKFGAFLAGPWGIAITAGAMAIDFLVRSIFDIGKESEKTEVKITNLTQKFDFASISAENLAQVNNLLAESNKDVARTAVQAANALAAQYEAKRKDAATSLAAAKTERATLVGLAKDPMFAESVGVYLRQIKVLDANIAGFEQAARGYAGASRIQAATSANLTAAMGAQELQAEKLRARINDLNLEYARGGKPEVLNQAIALQKQLSALDDRAPAAKRKSGPKIPSWLKPQIDGIEKLNQQLDAGVISWSEYSRALLKISDTNMKADNPFKVMAMDVQSIAEPLGNLQGTLEQIGQQGMDSIRGYTDEMKKSFDAVGMSVNDAFKGMLTAGMSWKDGMRGIIQSVINELWRLFVVQQIVGLVSNAIGGAFGGSTAKPDFSGVGPIASPMSSAQIANLTTRAIGGSVSSNTPYLVGERGPELFVPGGNGTIIPNKNMGGGSSGNTISVNVDARGSSDPAAVRAQVQRGILEAAPAIIAAAEQRTINSIRRPRLGGAMQ